MRRDRRSILAVSLVLLLATAVQGITPDPGGVVSSRFFELVSSGCFDDPVPDGGGNSSSAPLPRDGHDVAPDEVCSPLVGATSRDRLDHGSPLCIQVVHVGLHKDPVRTLPRRRRGTVAGLRGSDGLMASLCRFLC
jgi:hypothetical protein